MTKWYYVEGSERIGPVEQSEIEQMLQDGRLNDQSYVWKKGYDNWLKIESVEEFQNVQETELPPMMDDMPPVIDEAPAVEFSWDGLSESDKVISIKIGIDRGGKEVEYGPYTIEELRMAYSQNRISDKTLLYIPGMEEWIFLSDCPIFSKITGEELPPEISDDERRKNNRKPFVARMFFHDSKDLFEGVCRDISLGGMQVLVSNFPCELGETIQMNVHPDNDAYSFLAQGVVVRKLEGDQGFALRFAELDGEAKKVIDNYINQN